MNFFSISNFRNEKCGTVHLQLALETPDGVGGLVLVFKGRAAEPDAGFGTSSGIAKANTGG